MRPQNTFAFAASVELRGISRHNLHSMLISEQPIDRSVRRRGGKELWARLNFIKHGDVKQENITLRQPFPRKCPKGICQICITFKAVKKNKTLRSSIF